MAHPPKCLQQRVIMQVEYGRTHQREEKDPRAPPFASLALTLRAHCNAYSWNGGTVRQQKPVHASEASTD
jgi:hypothetical protein